MTTRRIFVVSLLVALTATSAPAVQPCEDGEPVRGDLGIGYLLCLGGGCRVNMSLDDGRAHWFAVEPTVWDLRAASPGAAHLRAGDAIVAIDGLLITSREGGERLARLVPGRPTRLLVRRDEREMLLTLVPEAGCGAPALRVRSNQNRALGSEAAPRIDFGMSLLCGACGWRTTAAGPVFETRVLPTVAEVLEGGAADLAGLRRDDVLVRVDGLYLAGPEAGLHLASIQPGDEVVIDLLRGGDDVVVTLKPQARRRS